MLMMMMRNYTMRTTTMSTNVMEESIQEVGGLLKTMHTQNDLLKRTNEILVKDNKDLESKVFNLETAIMREAWAALHNEFSF